MTLLLIGLVFALIIIALIILVSILHSAPPNLTTGTRGEEDESEAPLM